MANEMKRYNLNTRLGIMEQHPNGAYLFYHETADLLAAGRRAMEAMSKIDDYVNWSTEDLTPPYRYRPYQDILKSVRETIKQYKDGA